jgi:cytoskeletal protein RodZ
MKSKRSVQSSLNLPTFKLKSVKSVPKKATKKVYDTPLSVGEKLRKARLKLGIDLIEAEKSTLIRAKYLEAIESAKYYQLPNAVYINGFVQTYANYLKLNSKSILKQFQIEYGSSHETISSKLVYQSNIKNSTLTVTPKVLWTSLLAIVVVLLVGYMSYQVYMFSGVPTMVINTPAPFSEVSSGAVEITGKTDSGVIVRIGGEEIPVDENGNFYQEVSALEAGTHTINITAESRSGKKRSKAVSFKVVSSSTSLLQKGLDGKAN